MYLIVILTSSLVPRDNRRPVGSNPTLTSILLLFSRLLHTRELCEVCSDFAEGLKKMHLSSAGSKSNRVTEKLPEGDPARIDLLTGWASDKSVAS